MIGRIKFLVADKGYGFIQTDEGDDYFFHLNQLKGVNWIQLCSVSPPNTLNGPAVLFQSIEHKRGPRAISIELIEEI